MATPKIIPYQVKLRSTTIERSLVRPIVYTNDLRSAEFQFQVTDMQAGELSGATATTLLYMRDGSFFQNPKEDVELTGTTFSYLLKEDEGNHAGIARIQLVVRFNEGLEDEQNFPSQLYDFEIVNGLETQVAQQIMIHDWTTLTREARAYIDEFAANEILREAEFDNNEFDRNAAFNLAQTNRQNQFSDLAEDLTATLAAADANIEEFDVALETGIAAAKLAEKLEDFEEINNSRLLSTERQLAHAVTVSDTAALKADAMASGSPKGVYATLALLQAAYPTGTTGAYLVTADGKWYYWSGSAWTIGGTYQATGIADKSITPGKTSFFELGNNLLDLSTFIDSKYVYTDGSVVTSTLYKATDYFVLEPNTTYYYLNVNNVKAAFYDGSKVLLQYFTTGTELPNPFTTGATVAYGRFTSNRYQVDNMISKSPIVSYEPFEYRLTDSLIKKESITNTELALEAVNPHKISKSYDLLQDVAKIVEGKYIGGYDAQTLVPTYVSNSGYMLYHDNLLADGYLKVRYSIDVGQSLMLLDSNDLVVRVASGANITGNLIPGISFVTGNEFYTVDIKALRAYYPTAATLTIPFKKSATNYIYAKETYQLTDFEWLKPIAIPTGTEIVLPSSVKIAVGREMNFYYDNVLKNLPVTNISSAKMTDLTGGLYYKDSARLTMLADTTVVPSSLNVYLGGTDKADLTKKIAIQKVSATAGSGLTKKCLFIGDSMTDSGKITQELITLFGSDAMDIELLGSSGTAPNNHEGRSGWAAYHYTDNASYNAFTNAFWNPNTSAFDFSYYMTQQGYASVDYVFLCLGTNDITKTTDWSIIIPAWNEIIASIKAYNANIKIGLWLLPMPCELEERQWQKNNFLAMTKMLIDTFDSRENENLYLMPVYLNVDPLNDFNITEVALSARNPTIIKRCIDVIHPADSGYYKIADVIYSYIKYLGSLG